VTFRRGAKYGRNLCNTSKIVGWCSIKASIAAIAYHLPEAILDNAALAATFTDWKAEKITEKTGILERHIAAEGECASDLAVQACRKLFECGCGQSADIDFLLLCTQSPDYFLPTTACVVQERLGLPTTCGALDFNLGCSGFVYGLGLAKGLVETGQAKNVLLVTAETYSKFVHQNDRSVRTIFGDGAAATLVQAVPADDPTSGEPIGSFIYGTDGRGAKNLIVPRGGMRHRASSDEKAQMDAFGNQRTSANLYMNGAEIFSFTLRAVPEAVHRLLAMMELHLEEIDLIVFHQANRYVLEHLQKKLKIPNDKFVVTMEYVGNTVSSTIPIALSDAVAAGRLRYGQRVMIVGWGVGYSWAATVIRWRLGCP
jgi:3-oxoacyl-[acyl-carrier-protein] synthase-3